MINLRKPNNKPINVTIKYNKIKKPKKDEILIFKLPKDTDDALRDKLTQAVQLAQDDKVHSLIVAGDIDIIYIKKKQIRMRKHNESNPRKRKVIK